MKKLITLLIIVASFGCVRVTIPDKPYKACMHNSSFSNGYQNSYIYCDSFQMISAKSAFIWVDSTKMRIEADIVRFETNKKSGSYRE